MKTIKYSKKGYIGSNEKAENVIKAVTSAIDQWIITDPDTNLNVTKKVIIKVSVSEYVDKKKPVEVPPAVIVSPPENNQLSS